MLSTDYNFLVQDYGEKVKMSFAVNGVHQGDAFTIEASEINNQPLFPHLLTKNIKFQANFGQSESEFPTESGYTWAAKVAADEREPGPRRPERREDCEVSDGLFKLNKHVNSQR